MTDKAATLSEVEDSALRALTKELDPVLKADIPAGSAGTDPGGYDAVPVDLVHGYDELFRILVQAYQQAAIGKGRARHAMGVTGFLPWDQQPILANARQVGPAGPAQQVMKKAGESVTMAGNKNFSGAKAEALGAIVYAAALFKLYEEMEAAHIAP